MRLTMSSTRCHWRAPTCEGPRHAAPMQKRVLPDDLARSAACKRNMYSAGRFDHLILKALAMASHASRWPA